MVEAAGLRTLAGLVAVWTLAIVVVQDAGAAPKGRPGTLDRTFGHRGKVFAAAPPTKAHSEFGSAVRETDGDLVLELRRETRRREGGVRELERRLPDGTLDRSFGKDGRVILGTGAGIALRTDGGILVGTSSCQGKGGSVSLFDQRGARVRSFGTQGCGQSLPFTASLISVDANGRILLAGALGYCPPCGHDVIPRSETVVARLLPNGDRDPSFGKDGVVRTRADYGVLPTGGVGEESLRPTGIAPTGDGGAVISAGKLLLRLDADGMLKPDFGANGVAEVGGHTAGLLLLPDGSIVVTATVGEYAWATFGEIIVSRFRSDGTLDPGFGSGGTAHLSLPAEATARAVAATPGDGIMVAGEFSAGRDCRGRCSATPVLARLGPNGQPDPAYGSGGVAELPPPPNTGYSSLGVSALVVAPDGTTVVVGGPSAYDAFAIARAPDGTPSSGFGEGGTLIEHHYLPPDLEVSGFALKHGGGFTVAAEGTAGTHEYGGFLLRFRKNGRQRPGPSGNGVAPTLARGEIQPSRGDRVVSWWEGHSSLLAVGRHGGIFRRYGKKGAVELPRGFHARAIDEGPRGGVTVVGTVGAQRAMAVYRLNRHGAPVAGFGRRGLATVRFGRKRALAYAALVQADGGVVLTGWVNGRTGAARLLPNGRLDRRFGHRGRLPNLLGRGSYGTQIDSFGRGVVIASTTDRTPRSLAGIVRLDRRGRRIRGFGHRSAIRPRTRGKPFALLTGNGRVVVVTGVENSPRIGGGVELRAYRANGSIDRRFGRRGLARGGVGQAKYFDPVAAVQQRDGKICVVGSAWNGAYGQVELLRFH
jgi:uncharacterized delta-60 repeat protein